MKVLFVIERISFLDISSIPILSSIFKKNGHQVKLSVWNKGGKAAKKEISSFAPEIIAYSITSEEAPRYLAINNKLKKEFEFFSIFGGALCNL